MAKRSSKPNPQTSSTPAGTLPSAPSSAPAKTPGRGGKRAGKRGAGRGGNPPIQHQFKPGQSGNPAGRPAAGASLREWVNTFDQKKLSRQQLLAIARDDSQPFARQAAAIRCLRTTENPNMADFEPLLRGTQTLEELAKAGVDTSLVKRIKERRKAVVEDDEHIADEIERDIELHDRGGEEFDRICDRTDGKPRQVVDVHAKPAVIRTPAEAEAAVDTILARIAQIIGQ